MKKSIYLFIILAAAAFTGCLKDTPPDVVSGDGAAVVINEAHSRGKDSQYPLDWVELYNNSDMAVDISGYVLSDKADMSEKITIPAGTTLAAHGFLMVVVDTEEGFGLSSDGDVVYLYNNKGQNIDNVEFGPMNTNESWAANPDGSDTFEMMTPTPGASNTGDVVTPPSSSSIVLNEAHSRGKDSEYPLDWVELYNKSDLTVDIGGYILSDKADMSEKITIPAGTSLPAGGFLMVVVDTEDGFGLSSDGDTVHLYDKGGDNIHSITFGPMETDESWSAVPDGSNTFKMQTPTPGESNVEEVIVDPSDSPVRLNEAHSRGKDSEYPLDWVELYNNSDAAVDISGYVLSDKADMSEKVTIPAGTTLVARGFLKVEVDIEDGFGLSSGGDVVYLYDKEGEEIHTIEFGAMETTESWSAVPDGSNNFKMQTPTPGVTNGENCGGGGDEPDLSKLFINEVKVSDAGSDTKDWIELYNAGNAEIDLSDFSLSDSGNSVKIAAGKKIAAKGFLTFTEDSEFTFGLSANGETVTLSDADGNEIDRVATPSGLEDDVNPAYERTTDGGPTWAETSSPTKNASNN